MVHKDLSIFVFLREAISSFFTYSWLRLHFKPKFCYNFILMYFQNQCRIYQRFQIRSLIQNPSILSQDIPLFLAQLLQNSRFLKRCIKILQDIGAVHKWRHGFRGGQRFETCLTISGRFLRKKRDIGGGVKKSIFAVTSFMDDPISLGFLQFGTF